MIVGTEWLIEATGCKPERLRDEQLLRNIFERVIEDLGLRSIGTVWHKFTYPEHGTATLNLYCCRSRPEWDWETNLRSYLGARDVTVTKIERGEVNPKSKIGNPKLAVGGGA
jgi:S-adenosylmethionine decarboxylase